MRHAGGSARISCSREAICMTFGELRQKDVINICDGRRLGRPVDLVLQCDGDRAWLEAIVTPGPSSLWRLLRSEREGCAIPWQRIRRIGDDVILVDVDEQGAP